ncbi:anti-sigma factor family protein [Rhizobium miluonense]|uniref:Transmembrane transcriptional regulator (Anti-sigma factor RsiW) n=1 Tax=Rhizobium miluonense TaxID=411945 RepID=A0A1C3X293_9HYPH|nr:anti-sigma factor [Rhizobium miluonense]SCB46236.1 Transmembrane transcriptional regulator (anti-sigma factor RsiW) [Rhizobium miluonense]
MNENNPTVTEADLHAFADGLLPPEKQAELKVWLTENPEDAAAVAAWQAQNDEIRAMFSPYAVSKDGDADLISRSGSTSTVQAFPARPSRRLMMLAASLALFVAGAAAGHFGPDLFAQPELQMTAIEALPQQAHSAFVVYASDVRHPVEVGADQEAHLATWLGKRMNIAGLKVPSLQKLGFQLVGGRLLPINGTPGALFMYENASGQRLTVLLGRNRGNTTTSFRFASNDAVETFYWIDGHLGYAVTGEISRDMLRQVADECYKQFSS